MMNQSIVIVDFTKRWPRQFGSWLQMSKLKPEMPHLSKAYHMQLYILLLG